MPIAKSTHGAEIFFETRGPATGQKVVLIQGLSLSSRFWFETPDALALAGYHVLTVDNRGTGRSSPIRRPIGMKTMASDVIAAADAAGFGRAIFTGISMGGMIAQHVALRYSERVSALVLLATTSGIARGGLPHPKVISTLAKLQLRPEAARSATLFAELLLPMSERGRAKDLFEKWPHAFGSDPLRRETLLFQLGAVLGHETTAALRKVNVPTAIVTGDADVLVPPRHSDRLARAIPNAKLHVLPNVAHAILSSDPTVVLRMLKTVA